MLAAGHRSTRCTAALPSPVPPAATVSVLRNRALMAEFDWNGTDYQHILTGIEDKVLTITLNRPEARNAWTEIMRNEIIEVVDDSQRDPGVRVIVITGHPDGRAFCAGMDLSGMPGGSVMPGDSHPGRAGHSAFARDGGGQASLAVARSLKPVICAINGAAVGIGATFPCACDLRIAAAEAKFGFVFGQRGLTMEGCSSFFLPRLVGITKANDFVLTARIFECASEADCGLFVRLSVFFLLFAAAVARVWRSAACRRFFSAASASAAASLASSAACASRASSLSFSNLPPADGGRPWGGGHVARDGDRQAHGHQRGAHVHDAQQAHDPARLCGGHVARDGPPHRVKVHGGLAEPGQCGGRTELSGEARSRLHVRPVA
jgi:enoyl-CoA hydratase/carnithine racemase